MSAIPVDLPVPHRFRLTTPGWLRLLVLVAIVVAIVVGSLVASVLGAERADFTDIGARSAPQVVTSSDLYFALADLDAQAANVLLAGDNASLATDRQAALAGYDKRAAQAAADLQQAAERGTGDPVTQATLRSVFYEFGHYQALAGEALWLNGHPGDPAGRPSATALGQYRQATDEMRSILATTQTLITRNHNALDSAYAAASSAASAARLWVLVVGLPLLASLVALQVFLRRRLRRRLNPAMAVASAVAVALIVTTTVLLSNTSSELTIAKQDAFDSIVALSQARSISYDANADESRYLVDPGRAVRYQQAFSTKTQSIDGYFDTELHNVTFPGERAAAEKALAAYQVYQRDDRQLRGLATSGELGNAIAFDEGTAVGQSDYAFNRYDSALVALIGINQRAFNSAVQEGTSELTGWSGIVPAGVVVLLVLLVGGGAWPRLSEYRR